MAEKLVFLDESAVNMDLHQKYGRSIGKKRVVDHAPVNTPRSLTILGSMRCNGNTTYVAYTGGTTGDRFVTYLKEVLIPTLCPGCIVLMDNMRSHHVKAVEEVLQEAKMTALYLPACNPDLNLIEMLLSKIKSILRKWRCHDTALSYPKRFGMHSL